MFIAGGLNADCPALLHCVIDVPFGCAPGPIDENNFFEWEAYIQGPDDTPFEGGVFRARLSFPKDYPLNPPKVSSSAESPPVLI